MTIEKKRIYNRKRKKKTKDIPFTEETRATCRTVSCINAHMDASASFFFFP